MSGPASGIATTFLFVPALWISYLSKCSVAKRRSSNAPCRRSPPDTLSPSVPRIAQHAARPPAPPEPGIAQHAPRPTA
eukprot:642003-Rhodomonas_salina.1